MGAARLRKTLTFTESQLATTSEEVRALAQTLASSKQLAAIEVITQIKAIEARNNIRVDLRNGDVELLCPVEFMSRKVTDAPDAELSDVAAVEPLLTDLIE